MEIRDRVRELRRVPASELRPSPKNWRSHPDRQRRALRGALAEVGFADAVIARELADGSLELIDGHLRREEMGDDPVPVLVVDLDEAEAAMVLATLDPLAAMAEADQERLGELLAGVQPREEEMARLVTFLAKGNGAKAEQEPEEPQPPAEPTTRSGDLWRLGEHRLLCADTFEDGTLARLLDGAEADCALTDPPFAIYGSSTGISSDIADDKMVRPFFEQLGRLLYGALGWFAHAYVHCDWRSWAMVWEGMKRGNLAPKNCLVWDKGSFGMGSNWPNAHEFIGFFAKLPPSGSMTSKRRTGQRQVLDKANILRFPRVGGAEREHNAAKPVALLAEIVEAATDPGELVLDPFAGSGSTLIACERTGRTARLVEMEPSWCDVTIARWERETGGKAERA